MRNFLNITMNMRKFICSLAMLVLAITLQASPAYKGTLTATQPDGSKVDFRIHGDEYFNYMTTADGYTVVKDIDGFLRYAQIEDGKVTSTGIQARNASQRTSQESAMLQAIGKHATVATVRQQGQARRAKANAPRGAQVNMLERGLVILIQFKDTTFSRSDAGTLYQNMMDQKNYTGYTNPNGSPNPYGHFDGSVRDYYYENSMGQYEPRFDVVGPVTVNYSVNDPKGTDGPIVGIFRDALNQLDPTVDFSQYDFDNDGYVDVLYFIFAGTSASSSSDNQHLWPHESSISYYRIKKDGVMMGKYSCSTEFLYQRENNILDGIGTVCHEFGHALGLMDLYDTDYGESGGYAHDPEDWDLMSGGSYLNYGRTPAALTIFERYVLGWAQPTTITEPGTYTLKPVSIDNEGFIINTYTKKEYFFIDNRQKSRWDAYIPGHGMIVCRVDSTNASIWSDNDVNVNPSRLYYEMLRAGGTANGCLPSDPFPGTLGCTLLTNKTLPNLRVWSGRANPLVITDITESDGVISFKVEKAADMLTLLEDFESMEATTNTSLKDVQGNFTTWSFTKSNVKEAGEGNCNGLNAVAMKSPSALSTSTPLSENIHCVSVNVYNPTNTMSKFTLYSSVDQGATWTAVKTSLKSDAQTVLAKACSTLSWPVDFKKSQQVLFRLNMTSGSKSTPNYADDFIIYYHESQQIKGDVNGDGEISIADVTALVNLVMNNTDNDNSDVNGDGETGVADITALVALLMSL